MKAKLWYQKLICGQRTCHLIFLKCDFIRKVFISIYEICWRDNLFKIRYILVNMYIYVASYICINRFGITDTYFLSDLHEIRWQVSLRRTKCSSWNVVVNIPLALEYLFIKWTSFSYRYIPIAIIFLNLHRITSLTWNWLFHIWCW